MIWRRRAFLSAALAVSTMPWACASFSAAPQDSKGSDAASEPDPRVADSNTRPGTDRFSCSSTSALCDDFDDGMLGVRWTDVERRSDGGISIAPAGLSLPN